MDYKDLPGGFRIPVLGLGTWKIGGGREPDYSKDDEEVEIIKQAILTGYTHIDTAEIYGGGHTEELVGTAITEFNRSKLFLTTKVSKENLRYDDLISAAKSSLERLQTDYIDLYLIHAPNPSIPIKETMNAMDNLISEGLVKYVGVSNFTVSQLKEAQKYSNNKIVVNQIEYSLLTRNKGRYANNKNMESETIPYCQKNDVIVMAERPVERGILLKPRPVIDRLSEKYGKTRAQIVINWLISKKNIVTIPKSTDIEHLKENLGSIGWNLNDEDIKLLDRTNFER